MSKVSDNNYFQVSGWMLNKLKLKGIALEVYAIVYGFSQDGESEFTGSIQYLCDFTGTSRPTVIKALKDLVEQNYLFKTELEINGVKFNKYKANLQVVKEFNEGSKETLQGGSKDFLQGGSKETLHNNKAVNKELLDNIKYIIEYLNEKAGKNFRATSKANQQHINAKLSEGYSIEDFKTVIDRKCIDWIGTEYEQYLRPSTLFGTKFENYLNAKSTKQNTTPKQQKVDNGIQQESTGNIFLDMLNELHEEKEGDVIDV